MHLSGYRYEEIGRMVGVASTCYGKSNRIKGIELKGISTHFAEPADEEFSQIQKDRFQQIIQANLPNPLPL